MGISININSVLKIVISRIIPYTILACVLWSFLEPKLLTTKSYTVTHVDIPVNFDGYRIGFVSDLHVGRFTKLAKMDQVVARLKTLDLDLLILGGDYIYKQQDDLSSIFQLFSSVECPDGIYGVSGNHDHWMDYEKTISLMEQLGIIALENKSINIERNGQIVNLLGVPDLWYQDFADWNVNTRQQRELYRVLISHNPDYLVSNLEIYDLGLAGHTHGGQVTFLGLWAPFIPTTNRNHWKGRKTYEHETTVIISKGIGVIGVPMRLFAPPEITVVVLNSLQ